MNLLRDPILMCRLLGCAFYGVLFLQSGIDKVTDFKGNLSWLEGHFSKTPVAGGIRPMLAFLTLMEILSGILCVVAGIMLLASGSLEVFTAAFAVCGVTFVMLFSGQRIAKDYPGAASLVPYFIGAIFLLSLR